MYKLPQILVFLFFTTVSIKAQNICNDFLATNFQENDECVYPTTYFDISNSVSLDRKLKESSALINIDGKLWTLNDSGNKNEIYQINKITGEIEKTVAVINAKNIDWESMTANETHLFIGDFGNNKGNRKDLKIYKIKLEDIRNKEKVSAEIIQFKYEDQNNFNNKAHQHNFDCEALVYLNNQLHLFTKNWANGYTKHYTLPLESGEYTAVLVDSFYVEGLITAASLNPEKDALIMIGYDQISRGFLWVFKEFEKGIFFKSKARRIELGSTLQIGQIEGVCFYENKILISSEDFFDNKASLHQLNINQFILNSSFKNLENYKLDELLIDKNKFQITFNNFVKDNCEKADFIILDIDKNEVIIDKKNHPVDKHYKLSKNILNIDKQYLISLRVCNYEYTKILIF